MKSRGEITNAILDTLAKHFATMAMDHDLTDKEIDGIATNLKGETMHYVEKETQE